MRAYHHREVKIEERDEQGRTLIQTEPIQAEVKIQFNPEEYPLITWWPFKVNIQQFQKISAQIPKKPGFFKTMKNILEVLLYEMISLEETHIFQKRFQQFKNSNTLIFLILMYVLKFQPQKRNLLCTKYEQIVLKKLSGETTEQLLFTDNDKIILEDSISFVISFLSQSPIQALSRFLKKISSISQRKINFDLQSFNQNIQRLIYNQQSRLGVYFKIINKSLSSLERQSDQPQQQSCEQQQQHPYAQNQNRPAMIKQSQQQSKQINQLKQRKSKYKTIQGDYFLIYRSEDLSKKASYPIDYNFELKSNFKSLFPSE